MEEINDDDFFKILKPERRAEPRPFLFRKIEAKLEYVGQENISSIGLKLGFACLIITLMVNGIVIFKFGRQNKTESSYQVNAYNFELYQR